MAMVSITEMGRRMVGPGRRIGSGHPSRLTAAVTPAIKSATGEVFQSERIRFRLLESLWIEAGFHCGDKMEVLFDPETMQGIIKKSERGYTLSRAEAMKNCNAQFTIPWFKESGIPFYPAQNGMEDVLVRNGTVLFRAPKI